MKFDNASGEQVVNTELLGINYDTNLSGVDASTHSLQSMDYPHSEIHSGNHYYIQGFLELAESATYYVKLVTPNNAKWSHFRFDIKSTGICTTYFDEAATGGMEGSTSIVPINNNRNSANTSNLTIIGNVTNASSYTKRLEADKWGADGFKQTAGGGGGREDELVLKQNTVYLRTFISGTASNIIQFRATWYEHQNLS